MRLSAIVRVFNSGSHQPEDAGRAETAVDQYLSKLPYSDALSWRENRGNKLEDEDHDPVLAAKWEQIDRDVLQLARAEALKGWAKPDNAVVEVEIVIEN
jgi:hypothetical protein